MKVDDPSCPHTEFSSEVMSNIKIKVKGTAIRQCLTFGVKDTECHDEIWLKELGNAKRVCRDFADGWFGAVDCCPLS